MSVSYSYPSWSDFSQSGIGPSLPLDSSQRAIPVSGVLPSGEGGGIDFAQMASRINSVFPFPNTTTPENIAFVSGETRAMFPEKFSDEWWDASGIYSTSPEENGTLFSSGDEFSILNFNKTQSRFSNGPQSESYQISDFKIFNTYIHHELSADKNKKPVEIPFISTFNVAIDYKPYGPF